MEIKWTPWRADFIKSDKPKDDRCVLCAKHEERDDAANLVLYRGEASYVLMNLYPYNPGHLMVVPYDHTNDFAGLPAATAAELMALGQRSVAILGELMNPNGFNLGMNLGRPAGAGIDQHLHLHVVPRWNGDLNFMPLIGGVKLIHESLEDTYAALKPLFDRL
ncbi:MAG TPA: HIT domain-containing protein [Herpetosiphonaceae bacterium]|nr:HIT domain-containing protein [Herpetosiphonaceae bacterium]